MWDAILHGLFTVVDWFYGLVHDWGLSIIIITLIIRLLLTPLTNKQTKSMYKMQKLNPKLQEIRAKYAGDPQRMNEETMRIYQEAKANPLAGCLPMVLQMPIFIALYGVLQNLGTFIENNPIRSDADLPAHFYTFIADLSQSPGAVYNAHGITAALPYIVLLALFAVSILVPALINKTRDRNQLIMMVVMTGIMLFFGWNAPAGVLLYWDTQAYFGVAQQIITRKVMEAHDAKEEEQIEIKPVRVEVERKTKKSRPKKGGK